MTLGQGRPFGSGTRRVRAASLTGGGSKLAGSTPAAASMPKVVYKKKVKGMSEDKRHRWRCPTCGMLHIGFKFKRFTCLNRECEDYNVRR